MTPAGVILAAGESSRMGTDKALLPYDDTTFVEHLLGFFLARVSPVVVVLGYNAARIAAAVAPRPGLQVVVNQDYALGQLSSLQTGLRALPADAPAVLVTLVDHPAVRESTLDAILARASAPLAVPRHQGRRGHPVLFSRRLIEELLALPPTASAKQVVHAHRDETILVEVDDPGILRDIDTPEDYRELEPASRAHRD